MDIKTAINTISAECDSFYLYDENSILERTGMLRSALPFADFLYSVKCNHNAQVVDTVFSQGFGADAASLGEVMISAEHGVLPENIFYSAPGKSRKDIEASWGKANLIADSLNEIRLIEEIAASKGEEVSIGVRVNPEVAFDGGHGLPSKFGIDEEQFMAFLAEHDHAHIHVAGIHVHLRSQELNADVIAGYHENVMELASKVEERTASELEYINLGSGIGIPYADTDEEPDLTVVADSLKRLAAGRNSRILIEVGRYAVGKSGFYATRVMDRKVSQGKTFVILKNTLNGFVRPSLARLVEHYAGGGELTGSEPLYTGQNSFSYLCLHKAVTAYETVDLVGNLCTATDVIAENIRMPHLEPGDMVIINNAGAYAAVLSPVQFSSQERPGEFFLKADGSIGRQKHYRSRYME